MSIRDITNQFAVGAYRYTIKKNAIIIDADDGHFVFKPKGMNNDVEQLFKYLKSRDFGYLPDLIDSNEQYNIYRYIDDVTTPNEQKALDMMYLLSLLHNKTTYYKDINEDELKAIYEDIIKQIDDIYNYYNVLIDYIEQKIYMSPSEYLLARNISRVFGNLIFCRREIERWYDLVKDNHKKRVVTLHNNIDLDHVLRYDNLHLLSWDNARRDMPLFDIFNFYRRYALELNFDELLKYYESKYKLLTDERLLLFVLISIPSKIKYIDNEIVNCKTTSRMLDYIYKTETLITPYYTKDDIKEK